MSRTLAAVLAGAAVAMVLVGIAFVIIWLRLFRARSVSRTSETRSSDPSVQVGGAAAVNVIDLTLRDTLHFNIQELSLATKSFSDNNLIGHGKFGDVFKGLLHDGMLVAIKRRPGSPTQDFIEEVRYLSSLQHRNLVNLLGYCQENGQQFLVYEYIPNGSVSIHLYGTSQVPQVKLEFKHRLSIALGAAKALAHIHSLSPRLIHKDFKTANVLVDENFIPKIADAGLLNFLGRVDIAGPSSEDDDIFIAPEVKEFKRYSEKSDVYSFGVFLLELVSGRQATDLVSPDIDNLIEWVGNYQERDNIGRLIDQRLGNSFTSEGMEEFVQLIVHSVEPSSERRPAMSYVVMELDRILDKEMSLTTIMGEGTPVVTLGSQLFKTSK